jgi:catechol 2,3-dioxygenase-like lactoylglutathione lyase family enzyme
MTVLKVDFVGIRSNRLDETVALFRDVLGVSVDRQTDDLVAFKLADGTVLELYGPANEFHSFFTTGPVVAFRVDNFDVARRAMLTAGRLSRTPASQAPVRRQLRLVVWVPTFSAGRLRLVNIVISGK